MFPAIKWGLTIGIISWIVGLLVGLPLILTAKSNHYNVVLTPYLLIPYFIDLLFFFIALCMAGYYASRDHGRLWSGTLASVVSLLIVYVLDNVINPFATSNSSTNTPLFIQIITLIIVLLFASMLGWMGAHAGVRRYKLRKAGDMSR